MQQVQKSFSHPILDLSKVLRCNKAANAALQSDIFITSQRNPESFKLLRSVLLEEILS